MTGIITGWCFLLCVTGLQFIRPKQERLPVSISCTHFTTTGCHMQCMQGHSSTVGCTLLVQGHMQYSVLPATLQFK